MTEAIVGWKSGRVRLVPPDRRLHLENALRWMNDPEITATLEFNLGISRKQEEAFFDRIEGPERQRVRLGDPRRDGTAHRVHRAHRDQLAQPRGDGRPGDRRPVRLGPRLCHRCRPRRTRFAFAQLGLHRINGHTFNPAMKRVYEKCGYQHEGTARSMFFRDGKWHDVGSTASWRATGRSRRHPPETNGPHAPRPAQLFDAHGDDHAGPVHDRDRLADHLDLEPDVADRRSHSPAQRPGRSPEPGQDGPRFPGRAARPHRRAARSPDRPERRHSPGPDLALPGHGHVRGHEPDDCNPSPDRQRHPGTTDGAGDSRRHPASLRQRAVNPRSSRRARSNRLEIDFYQGPEASAAGRQGRRRRS